MSNPGERDFSLDNEVVDEVEIEREPNVPGADEDGDDALGEEPGDGDEHPVEDDDAGADDGQAGQPAEVAARPRSAATIAVQEAKRAAKEAKAEAEATRRELNELRQASQGRQTAEQQNLERERLALMPPEEKFEYLLNKQKQDQDARFGAIQFQMQDGADRIAFQSLAARSDDIGKAYASVSDEVEKRLGEMRHRGGNADRETIAKYIIGERAVARLSRAKPRQAAKGQQNIQRQTTRPAPARGDIQGGQRRGGSEAEGRRSRLDNIEI
jgi:hypothetical protein